MDVEFNLQAFLRDMRKEQIDALKELRRDQKEELKEFREELNSKHNALANKVDTALATLQAHDDRMQPLEATHRKVKWLSVTAVTALFGIIGDYVRRLIFGG